MKSAVNLDTHTVIDIEFQPASLDIWDAKYRLSAKDGTKIDNSIDDTYKRVAQALANVEAHNFECGRPGAQAGDVDDQLYRVGYGRRLDGQHPEQGARGWPDT